MIECGRLKSYWKGRAKGCLNGLRLGVRDSRICGYLHGAANGRISRVQEVPTSLASAPNVKKIQLALRMIQAKVLSDELFSMLRPEDDAANNH